MGWGGGGGGRSSLFQTLTRTVRCATGEFFTIILEVNCTSIHCSVQNTEELVYLINYTHITHEARQAGRVSIRESENMNNFFLIEGKGKAGLPPTPSPVGVDFGQ